MVQSLRFQIVLAAVLVLGAIGLALDALWLTFGVAPVIAVLSGAAEARRERGARYALAVAGGLLLGYAVAAGIILALVLLLR